MWFQKVRQGLVTEQQQQAGNWRLKVIDDKRKSIHIEEINCII